MPSPHQHQSSFGNRNRKIDLTFDPGDFKPVTPYSEDLKDEYQEAKHALHELRQKEEQIRRKAEQLEEITHKEEDFSNGRQEIMDQIEEYLDLLDHEGAEAQQIARECASTQQRFHHHLKIIQNLRPETAPRGDFRMELDLALRHLEDAENELTDAMPLIEHLSKGKRLHSAPARNSEISTASPREDFSYWLKAGFAFTLPVMMMVIALTIAFFYLK